MRRHPSRQTRSGRSHRQSGGHEFCMPRTLPEQGAPRVPPRGTRPSPTRMAAGLRRGTSHALRASVPPSPGRSQGPSLSNPEGPRGRGSRGREILPRRLTPWRRCLTGRTPRPPLCFALFFFSCSAIFAAPAQACSQHLATHQPAHPHPTPHPTRQNYQITVGKLILAGATDGNGKF